VKFKKAISVALAALLLLSFMPLSYAQPQERARAVVDNYNAAKAKYLQSLKVYKSARQDYLKLREKAGTQPRGITLEKARNFLLRSLDAMVAHLEMVEVRVKHTRSLEEEEKTEILDTLDSYIAWLEKKQAEAEAAEDKEQLVEVAREVREKWIEVRVEVKKISGKIIISKIDRILTRGEEIGQKLEDRVEVLKENGYDTTELEALLEDYREKLELAKESRDKAIEKFNEIDSPKDADKLFREGNSFVREANKYIKEMFRDLKQIFRELRKAQVEIGGTGTLLAKGNGSAVIQANGTVVVYGNGNLTVRVEDGKIAVSGEGEKQENSDGSVTYYGFGSARVSGTGIYVAVEGTELEINARGTGTALLSGEGYYRTARMQAEENWTSEEVSYGGAQNED